MYTRSLLFAVCTISISCVLACTARNVTIEAAHQIAANERALEIVQSDITDPKRREVVTRALRESSKQIEKSETERDQAQRRETWIIYVVLVCVVVIAASVSFAARNR